jgi:hypothetical protein
VRHRPGVEADAGGRVLDGEVADQVPALAARSKDLLAHGDVAADLVHDDRGAASDGRGRGAHREPLG